MTPPKIPIDAGMVRLASGLYVPEASTAYFGPGQPLPPLAPQDQRWAVAGRRMDYPFAVNTTTNNRSDEDVSFSQLRALADSCDLVRLAIQTRKDQLCALGWSITPRDEEKQPDGTCKEIEDFLRFPDGESTWNQWLREVLEDHFVLDAMAIYPWLTQGGQPYRLEIVDAGTIKRVLDPRGRTPAPPSPAFQQLVKNMPAVNYTSEELVYLVWNKRPHKITGMSPVQQVLTHVNIAIRRAMHQLQRYTEGSTPDLLMQVPADWNMAQIQEFNDWWQSRLAGNSGEQRRAQFVPNGVTPVDVKENLIHDQYDEWLARVVCFAFSLPPTAFVQQNNRATAESAADIARSEGLLPVMTFIAEAMSLVVSRLWKRADLCFRWKMDKDEDPEVASRLDDAALKNGSKTLDEVRTKRGDKPYGGAIGNTPMVLTASGFVPIERALEPPAPPPEPAAAPGQPAVPAKGEGDPAAAGEQEDDEAASKGESLGGYLGDWLRKDLSSGRRAAADIERALADLRKSFGTALESMLGEILGQLGEDVTVDAIRLDLSSVATEVFNGIARAAQAGSAVGREQVLDAGAAVTRDAIESTNDAVREFAHQRVGDLIGMRRNAAGEWVTNPNPAFAITDSTRELIRGDVREAIEAGETNQQLAARLRENYAFSAQRAEVIARTETATAASQGALASYMAHDIPFKQWVTAPECCDLCDALNGSVVAVEADFADGVDMPPLHPQCRCMAVPVFDNPGH